MTPSPPTPADEGDVYLIEVARFSGASPRPPVGGDGLDMLRVYFERRRDVLIAELREIDRLLGRAQTVPVRER